MPPPFGLSALDPFCEALVAFVATRSFQTPVARSHPYSCRDCSNNYRSTTTPPDILLPLKCTSVSAYSFEPCKGRRCE